MGFTSIIKKGRVVKNTLRVLICFLLAGCQSVEKKVIKGLTPGIEYRNQTTAPWPWVSVVPSERALALLKDVDFDAISRHFHFDMSFEPHHHAFKDVRVVLLDYTVLPEGSTEKGKTFSEIVHRREKRYFMVASFYKLQNRPPCPPDFEITSSMRADKAGLQEGMRFLARNTIEEVHALSDDDLLTPNRKITVDLD